MKFRRERRNLAEINLTSLIDVVFLLLIFFMVTTTFTRESNLTIELPEASGEKKTESAAQIEVFIDALGNYSVNGSVLTANDAATLSAAITELTGGNTKLPFIITADARTPHQSVVTVMDTAGKLSFSHLSITTRKPEGE
ncbi:MAG: biopolymer transporter ExbD [Pseudomonadales bacterium]